MIKGEQIASIKEMMQHKPLQVAQPLSPTNLNDNPRIIFEDQHLIVLSKPAGLLSQGEYRGEPNLVDWLRRYLSRPYIGLIHRLDRNTSGIMIVAKRTKAAQRLTNALQSGKIHRSYLGWVIGNLKNPVQWIHTLEKDERQNRVRVIKTFAGQGKQAILTAHPLRTRDWNQITTTLVEFVLETGRSHQIRVQCAHEGFPLLGERKYQSRNDGFLRVALHSYCLRFSHPMSHEELEFKDPLPRDLEF